jgi:hypothetical protein
MPRGNGTGPLGSGAMTGRGAGSCVGTQTPGGGLNPTLAGGYGRARRRNPAFWIRKGGGGRGMCNMIGLVGQPGGHALAAYRQSPFVPIKSRSAGLKKTG